MFSTMNAEFSIGALPSPVMSRAPSNTVTPVAGIWLRTSEGLPSARNRDATKSRHDILLAWHIPASCEIIRMDGDPAYPMTSVDESRMFSRSIPVLELLIVMPGGSSATSSCADFQHRW